MAADHELAAVGDSGLCRFGRWYQSVHQHPYRMSPDFLHLGELHEAIHAHALQLCQNRREGQDGLAQAEELLLIEKHEELRLLLNRMRLEKAGATSDHTIHHQGDPHARP
jgi:hypothetical protein